jgi:hypothetical protein
MKYLKKFENIGTMTTSDKASIAKLPKVDMSVELGDLISKLQKYNNNASGHESIQNEIIIYLLTYISNKDMDKDNLQSAKDALNRYLSGKSSKRRIAIPQPHENQAA